MLTFENKNIVFKYDRCCQCGVCLAACNYGALVKSSDRKGLLHIKWDGAKCVRCLKCVKICPVTELSGASGCSFDAAMGAKALYLAHAKDDDIRWQATSGGVVRSIIKHVLAAGMVDAVYTLVYPETGNSCEKSNEKCEIYHNDVMSPSTIEPTGEEARGDWLMSNACLRRIPCSLYRPVDWGGRVGSVRSEWRRILLVGLPCHIRAAKSLLSDIMPKAKVMSVSLVCHEQKTLDHTRFVEGVMGCRNVPVEYVTYRGQGWSGVAQCKGKRVKHRDVGCSFNTWLPLWRIPGCVSCSDNVAATQADIAVGDPWGLLTEDLDTVGANIVIVWTQAGRDLMHSAESQVKLIPISANEILRSVPPAVLLEKKRQNELRIVGGVEWQRFCNKLSYCEYAYLMFPKLSMVVVPKFLSFKWSAAQIVSNGYRLLWKWRRMFFEKRQRRL